MRVASSIATSRSEQMQRDCSDNGVKFGPRALRAAPAAIEDLLDESGFTPNMEYDDVAVCLSVVPASVVATPNYARAHVLSPQPQPRAHFKLK